MEADISTVSRGYFAVIGMDVLRGRPFGRQDAMDSVRVALVNRSFVDRYSREEDPIGRVIVGDWSNPKPTTIIGTVNDIRHNGLTTDPRPTIFLAQSQVPGYFTNLVISSGSDRVAIASVIRQEIRILEPRQPFADIRPMQKYVSAALARPRLYANFVGVFAVLALFLAATGIYGLLAYAVSRRTHEIGIRVALGARPGEVLTSTVWNGVRLVAAGVVLGIVAALVGARILSKYLFGIHPSDPLTYAGVAVVFAVVALAATYVPARRAASIDPVVALRYE